MKYNLKKIKNKQTKQKQKQKKTGPDYILVISKQRIGLQMVLFIFI